MPRASRIVTATERKDGRIVDTLILSHAQRQTQNGFLFGVKGTCVELDFPEPARLRTDDALVLDDGSLIEIVAEPEALIEVSATEPASLARIAWRLGDRHVPVQVLPRKLRLKRDPVTEQLLTTLGVKFVEIEAPFEPEGGAYDVSANGEHRHHHGHGHDHGHDHHHHDHNCHHDHSHDHPHEHKKS